MSRDQEFPTIANQDRGDERRRESRRDFLKASVAGALALPGLSCAAAAAQRGNGSGGDPARQGPDYKTQPDTWVTPWEWVQRDWPGQQLQLNVVEHAAPVALFGDVKAAQDANVGQLLFSWNGISPAPTIRIGGDETLQVKVRNLLGPNDGILEIPTGVVPPVTVTKPAEWIPDYTTPTPDYCRPIHTNHKHQIRTTNIHTHGLHVTPYLNPDGKNSDNIFLRIVPQGDYLLREATQDPECWPLKGSEVLGEADFEYRLGKPSGARETHPPGTHWYHPHCHGSTFTQVASGMAGLIIVEGDVDEQLKRQLDPTGEGVTYSERAIVIQRIVGPLAVDIEEGFEKDGQQKTKSSSVFPAVNGQSLDTVENYIVVRPGAVERWRVLNAGVDGQGFIEFSVREARDGRPPAFDDPIYTVDHLAWDGITLVNETGAYHTRKMTKPLMMALANRADFLFQAPELSPAEQATGYKLLSIWINQASGATDNARLTTGPTPTQKIATIIVRGEATPPMRDGEPIDLANYTLQFPEVPDYLKPVTDNDITIKEGDPDDPDGNSPNNGMRRCRRIVYSGWGGGHFPSGNTNRSNELIAYNKNPQGSTTQTGGVSGGESMMIDCRKFNDDPEVLRDIRHHMLQDTAEEWTVTNCSLTLFQGDPDGAPNAIPGDFDSRSRNLGTRPYATEQQKQNGNVTTKAADHPFHIHINPCWVIGVYDWEGKPLGWNYERLENGDEFYPRWQDVIRLPRSGGWVVFRSRFWDYAGEYVNHCHILQHEDNGMMQGIAVVLEPSQADYIPLPAGKGFPRPTWHECYTLDWGVAGADSQQEKKRCDEIVARLRGEVILQE